VKGGGPQARKSLCVSLVRLSARWFDPIAETSELPNHSPRALSFGLLGDGWAVFLITNSLVQDQPDQPTLSMGKCPDGLIMSQARNRAVIDNVEDATFSLCGCIGRLVEDAPHVTVARGRPVAIVHTGALVVTGAGANPRAELFGRRKARCGGTDFGNDLLC